jgi:hypothetical protein
MNETAGNITLDTYHNLSIDLGDIAADLAALSGRLELVGRRGGNLTNELLAAIASNIRSEAIDIEHHASKFDALARGYFA